jgi:ribosomal protein S18 acetylase RimI-like enzyme
MIIRFLVSRDKEDILRVLQQRGAFNEQEILVGMELLDLTLSHPEQQDYHIYCAFDDALFAGYICFGPIPMTEGCFDLYWIAVDEKVARKGIGGKLLQFMEEFIGRRQARRIYLDTSSTSPYEPARSFYLKHGFELVSVLEDYYRVGDHKMIFMKEMAPTNTAGDIVSD